MNDYPIRPVAFPRVTLTGGLLGRRLEVNRTVTIPTVLDKCEALGRVDDFRRAAGLLGGPAAGKLPWDDTDVYKAIEGASCALAQEADPALEARLGELVRLVAAAQEPDGYLYTSRTIDPAHPHPLAGPERWSSLVLSHELYNCGHLYEAAAAHHAATGSRELLEVALKSAALLRRVFGPGARRDVPGHQIVEMGLARLYRITGDTTHLELARFFLEERGRHDTRRPHVYEDNPGYSQDHAPLREQRVAVGHAVRAVYMYSGMANVAALLGEPDYRALLEAIWADLVGTRIYLTGGLGARAKGEAFGEAYELPNDTAYAETCAAMGGVMWYHRMFLLTGMSRYLDVLEQTLYNGVISCVSADGKAFFYPNPLASDGRTPFNHGCATRQPWFECSCCPTGLSRFLPSLPGYFYALSGSSLWVNLYAAGRARVGMDGVATLVVQETDYPWDGRVRLRLEPERPVRARMHLRIPGWARGVVLGSTLYRYAEPVAEGWRVSVNGERWNGELEDGYAVLDRMWRPGDVVDLDLPMPARLVLCDERVEANRGLAALQRGPLVYCVEGCDAVVPLERLVLGRRPRVVRREEGVVLEGEGYTAIPYHAWSNRGPGPMRVWLPFTGPPGTSTP